jgi:hypothetical protein
MKPEPATSRTTDHNPRTNARAPWVHPASCLRDDIEREIEEHRGCDPQYITDRVLAVLAWWGVKTDGL